MASYTDIIPQFNPYIQQLPVEAMVQVGMEKQKRYDEGVQKIQSQIDSVAGLDIYHPSDRMYLQSKLNELGNNLRTVAAGDFSNYQLVNSVGGMTTQIVKDKNVQNAVRSTQQIRKQQTLMDQAREKGTLHRNNEIFFNDQVISYLNNNKVGQVFGENYQPYTDYQKKWLEVQKSLGIKETQTDLPFVMQDGKIVIDPKTKKPMVNDYMVRETFKGVDAQRLKEAIMAAMDDNDYAQMKIDAYVSYKGYTPDMLIKEADSTYRSNKEELTKTIDNLTILKTQNVGNQQMTKDIDVQLEQYKKQLKNTEDQYRDVIAGIQANPEGYKQKLFAMNSINNFANSFSNISHIQNIVDSPIKKQMNEDRAYNFKVVEFNTKNAQWQKEFGLKVATESRLANKEAFDQALALYKEGLGPNPLGPTTAKYVGAPPTDKEILDGMVESFKQGADIDQLNNDKNALKVNWAKNQPSKADYAKQKGIDLKNYTDAQYRADLDKQFNSDLAAYNSNKNSVDAPTRKILGQYSELDRLYKLKVNAINDATEKANALHPEVTEEANKLSNNKVSFLDYTFKDGKPGVYNILTKSAREIYEDIQSGKATLRVDKAPGGYIVLRYPGSNITYEISKKGGFFGSDKVGGKQTRELLLSVHDTYNRVGQSIKNRDADFAKILGETINSVAPVSSLLPKGATSTLLPLIEDKLGREQKGQTEELAGFVKGKDFNFDTVKELALNPDTKVTHTTWGDNVFITMTGMLGKNLATQKFKISKSDFATMYPNLVDNTNMDFWQSAAANGSTNYKYHVAKSALMNPDDAFTSGTYDIPSKKYIVKGDIFFDQTDKNNTTPVVYVKSKKTGKVVPIPGEVFSTFSGSEKSMYQVNDLLIENYFKNNNLDADF
jgi:hypothetical protein